MKAVDTRDDTCYNNSTEAERVDRIKYSELKKLLKKAGCRMEAEGSNHEMWYSPITGEHFPVPRHKTHDVPSGTLKTIMKEAGLA